MCNACWHFGRWLKAIEKWNPDDSMTFAEVGVYKNITAMQGVDDSRQFVKSLEKLCRLGLGIIANAERKHRGEEVVDGVSLEHLFDRVADAMHARGRRRFHDYATTFEHTLDHDARALIHGILFDLLLARRQPDLIVRAYHDAFLS